MIETVAGWELDMERGPGCLMVRLKGPLDEAPMETSLADHFWDLMQRHFTYRLVLELDHIALLTDDLLGELVALSSRASAHDGMIRLCGLSAQNKEVLRRYDPGSTLPVYDTLDEALFAGHHPRHPR